MSTPFTRPTAQTRAGEFLVHLIEALSGRAELKIDMRPALGRLEELLNTQRSPRVREPLLAMYLLWHRLLPAEVHRPTPASTMAAAMEELQRPSMYSFAAGLLLGETPLWSVDELCELAEQRYGRCMWRGLSSFPRGRTLHFGSALPRVYCSKGRMTSHARQLAEPPTVRPAMRTSWP